MTLIRAGVTSEIISIIGAHRAIESRSEGSEMSLRTRLALAEKAIQSGDELVIVWVKGGFEPDSSNDLATAGGVEFRRGADIRKPSARDANASRAKWASPCSFLAGSGAQLLTRKKRPSRNE